MIELAIEIMTIGAISVGVLYVLMTVEGRLHEKMMDRKVKRLMDHNSQEYWDDQNRWTEGRA